MDEKRKVPVSVIIPTYNRAELVADTINCILGQTVEPLEIIVVDDGSTDASRDVIASYGERAKLITQHNQGPGTARNAGFKASSGEYIWFMDSDDLASANKIETQYLALSKSDYDFAYCPWIRCRISEGRMQFCSEVLQSEALPDDKPMLEWFLSGWSLVFQNCLFKRSLIERAGPYRTDLMPSEDSELFIRILLTGAKALFTPECMVFYREHTINKITGSGTSSQSRMEDWTRFLTITGNAIAPMLTSMKPMTRLALATSLKAHMETCFANGVSTLEVGHPYYELYMRYPGFVLSAYQMLNRVRRKVKGFSDYLPAFRSRKPGALEAEQALGIGYASEG
jgi:glycosyltransferase involved in cell wall biosynthesis